MAKSGKLQSPEKGGFWNAWESNAGIFLNEQYHLYYHDDDTEKERYFVDKERKEWLSQPSVTMHEIDSAKYFVVWDFMNLTDEVKQSVIKLLHNGKTKKISFEA